MPLPKGRQLTAIVADAPSMNGTMDIKMLSISYYVAVNPVVMAAVVRLA